ncbi:MAG: hypothetical protein K6G84_01930 [Lachnospiraceae bacterium]|nr:hypothetical protein [Lachnospiraceae bacterium]
MFFSKKEYTCKKCGALYESRAKRTLCNECFNKAYGLRKEIKDYLYYNLYYMDKFIPIDQYEDVLRHRNSILEEFRNKNGITIEELKKAAENYDSLSDSQRRDIITRTRNSEISFIPGGFYTSKFIMPMKYQKTIIRTADIFAVTYNTDKSAPGYDNPWCKEALSINIFTNDPYMPAFSMYYGGKTDEGMFKTKSSIARKAIANLFEAICPNLKYPIQEMKDFHWQLGCDQTVNGNINYDKMLYLADLKNRPMTPFGAQKLHPWPSVYVEKLANEYGYIAREQVDKIFKSHKSRKLDFWYAPV